MEQPQTCAIQNGFETMDETMVDSGHELPLILFEANGPLDVRGSVAQVIA